LVIKNLDLVQETKNLDPDSINIDPDPVLSSSVLNSVPDPNPDPPDVFGPPLVRGMDPDPGPALDQDPDFCCFVTSF
jgi:hypothetical protein